MVKRNRYRPVFLSKSNTEKECKIAKTVFFILNLNIRNKTNAFSVFFQSIDYLEILCLTESWMTKEEVQTLQIEGYFVAASFSRSKGGGFHMLAKNKLLCHGKFIKSVIAHDKIFEGVTLGKQKITISCLYKSPGGDDGLFYSSLEKLLQCQTVPNVKQICCDNFNIDFLNTHSRPADVTNVFTSY